MSFPYTAKRIFIKLLRGTDLRALSVDRVKKKQSAVALASTKLEMSSADPNFFNFKSPTDTLMARA